MHEPLPDIGIVLLVALVAPDLAAPRRRALPRSSVLAMRLSSLAGRLREVDKRLQRAYRPTRLHNPRDPLSDLVFLVLSAQTEEYNYLRTYADLRRSFRTWRSALDAGVGPIYRAIRRGGLGRKKATQIFGILDEVTQRRGATTLRWLRRLADAEALAELDSLPGVGPKTARCVLLYALDRPVFPVDTHVWRILRRLGFVSAKAPSAGEAVRLEQRVPPVARSRLHVNLVLHGRRVCTAARPQCDACVLSEICPKVDVML